MTFEPLLQNVLNRLSTNDPETRDLAARITTDAALLTARAAAGEDVEAEIQHLKAQALNLSAEVAQVISDELRLLVFGTIRAIFARA